MAVKADVLIVTVTEVESRAVMEAFRKSVGKEPKPEPIDDRIYLDLGEVNNARVFMALSEMGSSGVGGSQKSVDKGIEALSPSAVIMVGIAFGVNEEKQSIGDILVSQQLWLYELQRVGKNQIVPRGDKPHASPWLINRLQVARLNWDESKAKVSFGLLLSGEKLVDNVDYRDQLKQFASEAIGGEMEGAGVYVASQDKKVDWILVKSICDWADGQKGVDKSSRQQLAAQNAASFVLHTLQFAPLKRDRGSLPRADRLPVAASPVKSSKLVHSSLPSQPYFFGREKELGVIAEAIAPDARTWGALIDGPGGMGKTALAIRAAHIAPDLHFDRKIFLSAKVRELTAQGERQLEDFILPNYMALLTELAHELGDDDIERTDPNERPNRLRRALAHVRVLIVIDNVETLPESERMRLYQFLARLPVSCKAIVTSRRRSDIDARVVRVDRLEYKDVLDLIDELAKNNRQLQKATVHERTNLYEITNGNPLLIKWAAAQLGRPGSNCQTIADVYDFLNNAPEDNDPLEYIFGDLLDTFSDSETAVLAALVHFTAPAKVRWIADVAGIGSKAALTALEDLTDRALIVVDEGTQTYLLPPLVATFLRRTRPESISQTGARLTDRTYALALENGYSNYDGFPTLEAEWTAISAAIPLVIQDDNYRLQTFCGALSTFLDFSGKWDEYLSLNQQAELSALAVGDRYSAGWRAFDAAWMYYLRGQSAELNASTARCADHWENAPQAGAREKALAIHQQAVCYRLEKNFKAAIESHKNALALHRAIDPQGEDVAIELNWLAEAEQKNGMIDAAERHYRTAIRLANKIKDYEGVADYTGNLAELLLETQNWVAGEALAREGLELAEKLGFQRSIGSNCSHLARALVGQGKHEEAWEYAQRAVSIFTRLNMSQSLEEAQAILKQCADSSA